MTHRPEDAPCLFESFGATLPNGGAADIHLDTAATLGYYTEWAYRPLAEQVNAHIDERLAHLAATKGKTP